MGDRKAVIREHMQTRHAKSWPMLAALKPEDGDRLVYDAPEPWTVHGVLAHLADAERGLLGQVQRLVAGHQTVPEDFDIARWNRSAVRRGSEKSIQELLQAIQEAYDDALAFLEDLDEEALDLHGRSSPGEIWTLEYFLRRSATHRVEHAADIQKALAG
ncbi:MAG: DinB family protein [Anaerolineales bacterium]